MSLGKTLLLVNEASLLYKLNVVVLSQHQKSFFFISHKCPDSLNALFHNNRHEYVNLIKLTFSQKWICALKLCSIQSKQTSLMTFSLSPQNCHNDSINKNVIRGYYALSLCSNALILVMYRNLGTAQHAECRTILWSWHRFTTLSRTNKQEANYNTCARTITVKWFSTFVSNVIM